MKMKEKSAAYYTLGCKLNFTETSTISSLMEEAGFQTVQFDAYADYYIINTCSVTDNADKKCRYYIRKAKRNNPNSKVIIVGCYAQLKPKQISEIKEVDLVLGANEKFNLPRHLSSLESGDYAAYIAGDINEVDFYVNAFSKEERTRTFLKVQDGCDYSCSFCTIPLARGKSRSSTVNQIVDQANQIASTNKVKEIVLTGVNIGDFGKNKSAHKESFYDLVQALDVTQGIERFRISSIEPNLLSDEIIDFVASSKRFMPHFHIPLQSGSNKLLKLMRRRYLKELYLTRVEKIKKVMPHCCIGVDVIVGFPNESDTDFMDTWNFINDLDVSYLHVFTYSERNNTLAIDMDEVVPMQVRKNRSNILQNLSLKKKKLFYQTHLQNPRKVLWEQSNKNGKMNGFTDNYIKVETDFDASLINKITSEYLFEFAESGNIAVDKQLVKV